MDEIESNKMIISYRIVYILNSFIFHVSALEINNLQVSVLAVEMRV